MAAEHSPTVRRRRLALELRRLREAARLTCEEVAEHLECSTSKVSRIETGRVSVSPRDVRDMLDLYGVSAQQGASLVQLARDSRQKGWWHAYSDTIQPQFATYIGLESAASEIRIYEVTLIPGLLQTEEYARTVIAAGTVGGDHEGTERNVALLMARQPLLALARLPNVAIQVIPFGAGAHPAMGRPFVILAFPERADPDVVYLEDLTSALYVENVEEVDRYNMFFNHLRATALSFADSARLITSVIKGQ